MASINEGKWFQLTINPLDINGNAYTPTNARYRIDDKTSGNAVLAWTTVATADLSTSMDIQIDATYQTIVDSNKPSETKVLTVELDFGTNTASTEEIEYEVINLQFV